MRWFHAGQLSAGLLALNVRNTIAVDLNSILCASSARIFFGEQNQLEFSNLQIKITFFWQTFMVILTRPLASVISLLLMRSKLRFLTLCGMRRRLVIWIDGRARESKLSYCCSWHSTTLSSTPTAETPCSPPQLSIPFGAESFLLKWLATRNPHSAHSLQ